MSEVRKFKTESKRLLDLMINSLKKISLFV